MLRGVFSRRDISNLTEVCSSLPLFKNTTTVHVSGTGTKASCTAPESLGPLDGLTQEQLVNLRESLNQYIHEANDKMAAIFGKKYNQNKHSTATKLVVSFTVGVGSFAVVVGISWAVYNHANPPKQINAHIRTSAQSW